MKHMKNHIKSLILITVIALQSYNLTASRNYAQFGQSVAAQLEGKAVATAAATTFLIATQLSSEQQRAEWYDYAKSFVQSNPFVIPHTTYEQLPHLSKNMQLDPQIKKILDTADENNEACKLIMLNGDTGSGKTTTAEIIAAHRKTSLYKITEGSLGKFSKGILGNNDDDKKIEIIHDIARRISIMDPHAVVLLDEFGRSFLKNSPKVEAWRQATEQLQRLYPHLTFVTTSNIDERDSSQALDPAIAARVKVITLNNPDLQHRIDFIKNAHINIEQNAQNNGYAQIIRAPQPVPTIFEYIQSFIQPDKYNEMQQQRKNAYFKEKLFVTDAMLDKAKKEHEATIASMQNRANSLKTPWSWRNLIIPQANFAYRVFNAEAKYLESKIKDMKEFGYTPETVTHNLKDMNNNDASFLAQKTQYLGKFVDTQATKSNTTNKMSIKNHDVALLEDAKHEETGFRKLDEVLIKDAAQAQELKFINAIKKHIDEKESLVVTAESNPHLWEMMNNHRKFCAPTLSESDNTASKKFAAKLPSDLISSYNIDPKTRTYAFTTATPAVKTSEPITFGAITKAHLAAAAYGDDFASYNKKDTAASKIAKKWKASRNDLSTPMGKMRLQKINDRDLHNITSTNR